MIDARTIKARMIEASRSKKRRVEAAKSSNVRSLGLFLVARCTILGRAAHILVDRRDAPLGLAELEKVDIIVKQGLFTRIFLKFGRAI